MSEQELKAECPVCECVQDILPAKKSGRLIAGLVECQTCWQIFEFETRPTPSDKAVQEAEAYLSSPSFASHVARIIIENLISLCGEKDERLAAEKCRLDCSVQLRKMLEHAEVEIKELKTEIADLSHPPQRASDRAISL